MIGQEALAQMLMQSIKEMTDEQLDQFLAMLKDEVARRADAQK